MNPNQILLKVNVHFKLIDMVSKSPWEDIMHFDYDLKINSEFSQNLKFISIGSSFDFSLLDSF